MKIGFVGNAFGSAAKVEVLSDVKVAIRVNMYVAS